MTEPHLYIVCIGSNVLSESDFAKASECVRSTLMNETHSHVYVSADALGRKGVSPYINQVVRGYSKMELEELEVLYKHIEKNYGRIKSGAEATEVALDIDIVIADGKILRRRDYESAHFMEGLGSLHAFTDR